MNKYLFKKKKKKKKIYIYILHIQITYKDFYIQNFNLSEVLNSSMETWFVPLKEENWYLVLTCNKYNNTLITVNTGYGIRFRVG
jgi:hypothetical protein